ncbi:Nif11-like leader peptide family natural product precursor [Blautia sp. HCP3S3_C12]|uniref:Nif11-like leader peptide family natural product precursor n=1 Tax=unclassified Blautia TaxID=2648079 RepID=UPI003F8AC1D4
MNENLKQAILKVKEMPEVQEKLTKAETLEEVYEIMQSAGFTVSFMGSMMR